jgi:hypothetical protein
MCWKRPLALFGARIQPISPAFSPMRRATLKAAAADRGFRSQAPSPPATFAPARALFIRLLPPRKQCRECLRIRHDVTLSWSTCIRHGHQRYPVL